MRCKACNVELTDEEARRRDPFTGDFLDLCGECYTVSSEAFYDDDRLLADVYEVE